MDRSDSNSNMIIEFEVSRQTFIFRKNK